MDDEQSRSEDQLTDEERARLYREQLKRLRTIDLVQDMMVSLVTIGYQKLGRQTRRATCATWATPAWPSRRCVG